MRVRLRRSHGEGHEDLRAEYARSEFPRAVAEFDRRLALAVLDGLEREIAR